MAETQEVAVIGATPAVTADDEKRAIENIVEATDEREKIEKSLVEIRQTWASKELEFADWKVLTRGDILAGQCVSDTIGMLEESRSTLVQMLTQKCVEPFREETNQWLHKLSEVHETLELWNKVQVAWCSLESVFYFAEIKSQLPDDRRMFEKIDATWTKRLMNKARDVKLVVECCQDVYIASTLRVMNSALKKCQQALDGYVENTYAAETMRKRYMNANTALHTTAKFGSLPMIIRLLEAKIDPNQPQSENMTALHYACWQQQPVSVLKALMFHGARNDLRDSWKNQRPSDYLPESFQSVFRPMDMLQASDLPLVPAAARLIHAALQAILPEELRLLSASYLCWHVSPVGTPRPALQFTNPSH